MKIEPKLESGGARAASPKIVPEYLLSDSQRESLQVRISCASCTLVGRLCVVFFLACLVSCKNNSDATHEELRVGLVASLSGPASEQGNAWHSGAQLAAEKLASLSRPVVLVSEDDRSTVSGAVNGFTSLAKVSKVSAVIGGTWDFLAESTYPLARNLQVPFLTPSNPPEVLSADALANPYVLTNSVTIAAEHDALKKFLEARKAQTVGIVFSAIPWGETHAKMTREVVRELGIKLELDERFTLEAYPSVLSSIALKVKSKAPEVVLTTFDSAGLDLFAKELRRLQSETLTVNTQHLLTAFNLTHEVERFRNSHALYPRVKSEEFEREYKARFGTEVPFLAAHGYDAVMFIEFCWRKNGNLRRDSDCEYEGITGMHRLPTSNGALVENEAFVGRVTDGRIIEAQ